MIEISGIKKSHHAVTEGGTEILILIFRQEFIKKCIQENIILKEW